MIIKRDNKEIFTLNTMRLPSAYIAEVKLI